LKKLCLKRRLADVTALKKTQKRIDACRMSAGWWTGLPLKDEIMGKVQMILNLSDEDLLRMKTAALDDDSDNALKLIKEFLKRLDQQKNSGMKTHLGG
jgi:hypothetical protein